MQTHDEVVAKLMRRPGVRKEVERIEREEGVVLDILLKARNEAGLKDALQRIPALRDEFWRTLNVTGEGLDLNQSLEQAGRVADFMVFSAEMAATRFTPG